MRRKEIYMIYTSYFSAVKKLPSNICAISIAGWPPKGWKGPQYKALAPKWNFFSKWKENHDNDYYIEHFNKEVLEPLSPESVVKLLKQIAGSKDVCLCCFESPGEFCHRHLVANWLNKNGYECKEYMF